LELVERKFNPPTMKVVSVFWELVASNNQIAWSNRSLSEEKIIKGVRNKFTELDPETIRRCLDVLVDERCAEVTSGNEGRKFSVGKCSPLCQVVFWISFSPFEDVPEFISIIKHKLVETFIFERYGIMSLRLFRLLTLKGSLEESQVPPVCWW
jgi:hypothetical protein